MSSCDWHEAYADACSHEGLAHYDDWKCRVPEEERGAVAPSSYARKPAPSGPTREVQRPCPDCNGRGDIPANMDRRALPCFACDETGFIVVEEDIDLRIIASVTPSISPKRSPGKLGKRVA